MILTAETTNSTAAEQQGIGGKTVGKYQQTTQRGLFHSFDRQRELFAFVQLPLQSGSGLNGTGKEERT